MFDHAAQSIDYGIDGQLDQPVPLCREHGDAGVPFHIFANEIGTIGLVGRALGAGPSVSMTGKYPLKSEASPPVGVTAMGRP